MRSKKSIPMPDWFWQGFFVNSVYALITLGVGVLAAYLVKRYPGWSSGLLVFFIVAAAVAIIILVFVTLANKPKSEPLVTNENVEHYVKTWLSDFSLTNKKIEDVSVYWAYLVTLSSANGIVIAHRKDHDKYLHYECNLGLSTEHAEMYAKLSKQQIEKLLLRLAMHMAIAKITFNMNLPKSVTCMSRLTITPHLTEDAVMQKLDEIDSAILLAKTVIVIYLLEENPITKPKRRQ
jgi:hypothetical protein